MTSTTARIGAAVVGNAIIGTSDMPDLTADHFTWEGHCWEAVTDPNLNVALMDPSAPASAKEALVARQVQSMSVATKKLIVTDEAILNHATLIGQTVVDDINVQGKLIGKDGVFTGTVDFANVNVTGQQIVNKLSAGSIEANMIKSGSFSGETFVGGTFSGARMDGGEFTLVGTPSKETATYSQNFSSNAGGWVYRLTYTDERPAYSASGGRSGGCLRYNNVDIYGINKGYAGGRFYIDPIPDSGGFDVVRTMTAWVKASKALNGVYLYTTASLEAGSSTGLKSETVSLAANTWKQLRLDLPAGVKPRIVEVRFEHGDDGGGLIPQPTTTADIYLDDVEIKVPAGVASAAHLYVSGSGSPTFELASTSGAVLASLAAPVGGDARLQFPGGSGGTVELSSAGLKADALNLSGRTGEATLDGNHVELTYKYSDHYLRLREDGTGVQFAVKAVYDRTSSAPANVSVTSYGTLRRMTSSRRYKKNIVNWSPDPERVLALQPRQWQDREDVAEIDERWHVGFIAEEVDDLGLKGLVDYAGDGKGGWRPESLNYDRFAAAQQVVLQKHEAEIKELREHIALLEAQIGTQ